MFRRTLIQMHSILLICIDKKNVCAGKKERKNNGWQSGFDSP